MTRPICALFGLMLLAPVATASLDHLQHPERLPAALRPTLAKRPASRPAVEAQVTHESEVYLDGRRCQFKEVPDGSVIEKLILAEDGKTVLRIEFHSPR